MLKNGWLKKNNLWEIGVHIADVSFFVKKNTSLDLEAYERCFSLYLVDRVIPMLPEELSNEIFYKITIQYEKLLD